MASWSVKKEACWERMVERYQARADGPSRVVIATKCAAGKARSAAENMRVLAIQRAAGRNAFFESASERLSLREAIRGAMQRVGLHGIGDIAESIGATIVRFYRGHIDHGEAQRGSIKPDAESTLRRKAKAGRGDTALVDTGELRESLTFEVRRING